MSEVLWVAGCWVLLVAVVIAFFRGASSPPTHRERAWHNEGKP